MNKKAIREELMKRLWENKEYKKENTPFGDKSTTEYRGLKSQINDYLDFLEKLILKDYIPLTGITEEDFVDLGVNYINRIYCYKGAYSCREIRSYLEKNEFEKLAICLNFLFSQDLKENSALDMSLNFELCKCHRLTNFSNNRIVILALKM